MTFENFEQTIADLVKEQGYKPFGSDSLFDVAVMSKKHNKTVILNVCPYDQQSIRLVSYQKTFEKSFNDIIVMLREELSFRSKHSLFDQVG